MIVLARVTIEGKQYFLRFVNVCVVFEYTSSHFENISYPWWLLELCICLVAGAALLAHAQDQDQGR